MILEEDQESNGEEKKKEEGEDDVDDSVYGEFWEDLDARRGMIDT